MAIGRISGPMLFSNLERQGVDLAFESNLLYLDVTTRRVGVLNSSPQYSFDVSGNVKLARIIVQDNQLLSNTGIINFGSTSNITISGGSLNYVLSTDGSGNLSWQSISSLSNTWGNISIADNTISVVNTNGNLILDANGSGAITTTDDVYVNRLFVTNAQIIGGNIEANVTGNISSTTGDFIGNVTAPWFIGNVDGDIGNYTDSISVSNSSITSALVQLQDVQIVGNTILSSNTDLFLSANTNNPNNIVHIDGVSALTIPAGNTEQRPPSPTYGYLRYNTTISTIEWWSGAQWVAGATPIVSQSITPDGISSIFTLTQTATEDSILVNINGTMQHPGTAYTVSGNQITFAEVPLVTDIIDIRFIAAGTVSGSFLGGNISGSVNIQSTTQSTSTGTGALVVAGGAAIAGNINIGGNVGVGSTTGSPLNTASPSSWLKIYVSGAEYFLPLYQ